MQIVIDINDKVYGLLRYFEKSLGLNDKKDDSDDVKTALMRAVINGKPLPKGHGAIKDVSQIEIPMCEDRAYERWVQVAIDSAPTIIEKDGDLTEI